MRFSTTAFLLTCTVLLSFAFEAAAQAPAYTVTNVKNACGDLKNGSFTIHVTAATGDLTIVVAGPGYFKSQLFTTYTLPFDYTPPPVGANPGLAANDGGSNYNILVSDTQDNTIKNQILYNFAIDQTATVVTQNTNANCSPPNGAIDVTLRPTGAPGPITYSWSPGGQTTQDISAIGGGNYVLTYADGTNTCAAPSIAITDPTPTDFQITVPASVCKNNGFNVTVDFVDKDYTYSVLDGASVVATYTAPSNGTNVDIAVPALSVGAHSITVSAKQGSCAAELNQGGAKSVTVNDAPAYTTPATPTVCSNTATGFNLNSLQGSSVLSTSFVIVNPINPQPGLVMVTGSATGTPVGANEIADDVWKNTTNGPLTVTYTVNTFAGVCPGNQLTITFTITPQPDYNPYDNSTPGICSRDNLGVMLDTQKKGTSVLATSYRVTQVTSTGLTPFAGVSPLPTPYVVANGDLADDQWQNVTKVGHPVTYRVVPVFGTCDGDPFDVNVMVNPQPDYNNYNNNNVPGGICSETALGVDLTTLVKATSINAGSFIIDDIVKDDVTLGSLVAAGGGIPSAFPATIASGDLLDDQWTNTRSGNIDVVYKIRPVLGTCIGNQFTVTVTIRPQPDYNNYHNDNVPSICSEDLIAINLAGLKKPNSVVAGSFSITVNPNGMTQTAGAATTTDISDDKWENTTGGQLDVVYTITPTTNGCVGDDFTVTVTVDPEPSYKNYNDDNAPGGICSGDLISLDLETLAQTTVLATAYRIDQIIPDAGLAPGAGSPVADPNTDKTRLEIADDSWINNTAAALKVTYKIRPKTACFGNQFTVVVTINPRPSYNPFDNTGATGICADPVGIDLDGQKGATSILATAYDVEVLDATGLTPVAGAPALAKVFNVATGEIADDVWSNVTSTFKVVTYEITPKAGACAGTPFTIKVRIEPQPDYLSNTATPIVVCSGVAAGYDLESSKNGPSVSADSFTITTITPQSLGLVPTVGPAALNVPLPSSAIASDVWKNTTNGPLNVVYRIVPRKGTCTGAPFDITITVNPEPVYTGTTLPDICSGDAVGFDLETQVSPTGTSASTFTFTTSTSAPGLTPANGTTLVADTGNNMVIADDAWTNITAGVITLTYHITPKTAANCSGTAFDIVVNINPQPEYTDYTDATGVCSDPLNINLSSLQKPGTVAATTFVVVLPANLPQIAGASTPDDLTDDVWENATSSDVIIQYDITPKTGTCAGKLFHVTVTIKPTPAYNSVPNQVVCSKDAVAIDFTTLQVGGTIAATTFTITDNSPGIPVTSTDPNAISDDVWTNKTNAQVTVIYAITPKAGTCTGAPFTVTVHVNPEPVATATPLTKTICTGDNVSFDLQTNAIDTGNGVASNFKWKAVADNPNVGNEELAGRNANTIDDMLTNTTSAVESVQYVVTPTSILGCQGDDFFVTITVNPKPALDPAQTVPPVCSGTAVGYSFVLLPAGLPTGTNFTWQASNNPNVTGASTSQKNGPTITDVLVNNGTSAEIVHYTVTPILGTCAGASMIIDVTVNKAFVAVAGADQTICTDNGNYFMLGSSVSPPTTNGTWTLITNPGDGNITQSADPHDPTGAIFTATVEGDYVLELRTDLDPSGVCAQGVDQVTVTVTRRPDIDPVPKTICGNDQAAYSIQMLTTDFHSASVFTWAAPIDLTGAAGGTASPPGGVALGAPGTIHINDILRNETGSNIDVTYQVTPGVGLCIGTQKDIVITVKPSPVVAIGQSKTICSGERVDYEILLSPANSPAGTTFSWPDPDNAGSATSRDTVAADPPGRKHITDTLYHYDPAGLPTTVTYKVISQGVNGCYGATKDINIIVKSGAIAKAGPDQSACSDAVLTLSSAKIFGTADATWSLVSGPDVATITPGALADPATGTFQATTAGQYRLRLTTNVPSAGSCLPVTDDVIITVKPVGDPSCTGSGPGSCIITATITPADATCNNNDGSILIDNITGGTGPYIITLNGVIKNLPANKTIGGLTEDDYTIVITDSSSPACVKTFPTTHISFPGYVDHYNPVVTDPDCVGGGSNGSIRLVISDPGSFQFALTDDLINEPSAYNNVGDSVVFVPGLSAGQYAIWLQPKGAGLKCATKVVVPVNGIRAVTYTATNGNVICFSEPTSIVVDDLKGAADKPFAYTLTNTVDNSVSSGTIPANLPTYSITGINKGKYSLLITQDQSSIIAACTTPISGDAISLTVDGPVGALDTLYLKKGISVPDLPSGSALVGVAPSGFEPYEVRLELVQPVFASQQYVMDWTEVPLNPQNLKFEFSFTNLFAGEYVLNLRDTIGCEKTYTFLLDVDTQLYIPNIFTPNEDGHNDVFFIRNLPADAKLLITNRWGNEVYKSSSYQNDWSGGSAADGMYYYKLTLGSQSYTGWVEILRGQ